MAVQERKPAGAPLRLDQAAGRIVILQECKKHYARRGGVELNVFNDGTRWQRELYHFNGRIVAVEGRQLAGIQAAIGHPRRHVLVDDKPGDPPKLCAARHFAAGPPARQAAVDPHCVGSDQQQPAGGLVVGDMEYLQVAEARGGLVCPGKHSFSTLAVFRPPDAASTW